jgi:undecaprenyl-diphosphatase
VNKDDRLLLSGFAVSLAGAAGFAILARLVMSGATKDFDAAIRNAIHSWANPLLTRAMLGITNLGAPTFLLTVGAVLVWRFYVARRPRAAIIFAIATIGAELLDQALKYSFRRARPDVFFGMAQPPSYSFPSGHSVESACFYGVLAAILTVGTPSRLRKAGIWTAAALLTLAIGTSRIYLGVHYPTDVLGGYALAVAWAALLRACYRIWLRHRVVPPSIS